MEKILMYDDYGATTYIELCTFSIVYRSTKIDSNWLKHSVVLYNSSATFAKIHLTQLNFKCISFRPTPNTVQTKNCNRRSPLFYQLWATTAEEKTDVYKL